MEVPSFNELIQQSIIKNWNRDALTDYKGSTLQYHDVARKIEKLHIMFENSGVVQGCSRTGPLPCPFSMSLCPTRCITS